MDAAKNHGGAALPRNAPKFIPAQRVAGVDSYAHHVARIDAKRVELFQSFVADNRVAKGGGCSGGKNVQASAG